MRIGMQSGHLRSREKYVMLNLTHRLRIAGQYLCALLIHPLLPYGPPSDVHIVGMSVM